MSYGEQVAPFLGRLILAWYFVSEAYVRGSDWTATVTLLALKNVPEPQFAHFGALIVMVLGAFSLFIGFRTKLGALALFAFTIGANAVMHDYWHITDVLERQADYQLFSRNIAIAGGLLILVGVGPGKFAMDNLGARGKK